MKTIHFKKVSGKTKCGIESENFTFLKDDVTCKSCIKKFDFKSVKQKHFESWINRFSR